MSLHAQLSPEAIERLRIQKRNNSIGSFVIGLLVVALLALITGLLMIPIKKKKEPVLIYTYPVKIDKPTTPPPNNRKVTIQKPAPPRKASMKFIQSIEPAELATLVPDVSVPEPSFEMGTSPDFGISTGFDPDGKNFDPIIPDGDMSKRCSPRDRRERLNETGGSMEGERAVVRALDWLQRTQNEDGSWGNQYQSAMTGFAILAYLGHCEHPYSRKYGDTVSRAMTYLIDLGLKNDGKLTVMPDNSIQWVYEHAIATYALAEAEIFCRELNKPFPELKKIVKSAGERIMDGQADSGGWNYRYSNSPNQGDNSVGFWQIQALKACKHTDIWPDSKFRRTTRNAIQFLEKVQGQDGAIGYRTDPNRSPNLTGGGVLCMQIWGEGNSRPARKGVEWIRRNSQFKWGTASANLYYHYYKAQAMINVGGEDWEWYNAMFRDELIEAQNEDGSWTQRMQHGPINQHMATCLATLMLEVYYRFLPATGQ